MRGEEIFGIDLVLIDSDTAGLISKYIDTRGHLTNYDFRLLNHCYSDLKIVVKELKGEDRQYFDRLQKMAGQIIATAKDKNITTDGKSYNIDWEQTFLKIRKILNEWDPIGVADSVDNEYDTMNFRTLSVLINKRDKGEIKKILDDYTRNAMQLTVDSQTLDSVADRISKISVD